MSFFNPNAHEIIEHRKTKAALAAAKPKSVSAKHREENRIKLRNKLAELEDYHIMHDPFF